MHENVRFYPLFFYLLPHNTAMSVYLSIRQAGMDDKCVKISNVSNCINHNSRIDQRQNFHCFCKSPIVP